MRHPDYDAKHPTICCELAPGPVDYACTLRRYHHGPHEAWARTDLLLRWVMDGILDDPRHTRGLGEGS